MKYLQTFLLLIVIAPVFAQTSKVNLSEEFRIKESDLKNQVFSNAVFLNDKFFTVSNSAVSGGKWMFTKLYDIHFSITLSSYDRNLKTLKELELEGGERNFGPISPDLVLFGNQLILAYFKKENKSSFSLYICLVNQSDLSISSPIKVSTIEQENVGVMKIASVWNSGLYYFSGSPDQALLMITSRKSDQKIEQVIFDRDLKEKKRFTSTINLPDFYITTPLINNEGKSAMRIYNDQETRVIVWDAEGKKTEHKLAASGGNHFKYVNLQLSKNGQQIYTYGITVDGEDKTDPPCTGYFTAQLDLSSFSLTKPKLYLFSPDFIMKAIEKGAGMKSRKDVRVFEFRPQLIEMEEGQLAVVASPEDVSTSSYMKSDFNTRTGASSSHMVVTTTFTTGPVMIFYPDTDGKRFETVFLNRKIILNKSQRSGSGAIQVVQSPIISTAGSGFITQYKNGELQVIYTDNARNVEKGTDTKVIPSESAKDLALVEVVIGKDRKPGTRKILHDIHENNLSYYIGSAIPNVEGRLIFPIGKESGMKTLFQYVCYVDMQ